MSEQRRKKVQELETQIANLKQKQKEQLKLIRMKEQSEQKVNKLNSEIQVRQQSTVIYLFISNLFFSLVCTMYTVLHPIHSNLDHHKNSLLVKY